MNSVSSALDVSKALSARILVVDDDTEFRRVLVNYLEQEGLRVIPVSERNEVARQFAVREPSLVLLDLKFGKDDGLDLLREIRSNSDVPIIIMTRHDEIDRVVGLELGADACVNKPFRLRELLACVRAVLRRQELSRQRADREEICGGFRFDGWKLDLHRRRLSDPDGVNMPLTKGEYTLLVAFLMAPGRPLTREHLLQATRVDEDALDRSIDVQVLRLRRKLEVDPGSPRAIQTERGVGYRFSLPVQKV
jgi:two-component system OmpR family response regulator